MPRRSVILPLLAVAALVACDAPAEGGGERPVLLVSAASSVAPVVREVAAVYEERTVTRIELNVGSSGQLAQQIERGAPVEVFISANVGYVDELEREALIAPETRTVYARGRLVLWTPADPTTEIRSVEDLARPSIRRVAVANPGHAPYGEAAEQALRAAGVWEKVRPKLIIGENVQQAYEYAATGNADAALVAQSIVLGEAGWLLPVPQMFYRPLEHTAVVVRGALAKDEARSFTQFLSSSAAQDIFRRHGFEVPGARRAGGQ